MKAAATAFPMVSWRGKEALVADFTYDGTPDVALLGVEGATVYVVVVEGPVSEPSRVLAVRLTSGAQAQDSLCGKPEGARLLVEAPGGGCTGQGKGEPLECIEVARRLPEGARARGASGLELVNDDCDAFHVFFDGKDLTWWRL
jgi:hypothetical protein